MFYYGHIRVFIFEMKSTDLNDTGIGMAKKNGGAVFKELSLYLRLPVAPRHNSSY